MKFRNLIAAAAVAALPLAAHAATLVVPAAGTGPGANNSQWQSELTLHTTAPRQVAVAISYHQGTTVKGPVDVVLGARQTISIADIVRTSFGVESGTGALVIEASDRDAKTIAVTSRTFNTSATGEFGQDIPAVDINAAARIGDIAALPGPSVVGTTRFNFGVYAVDATVVQWDVVRADGTVAVSTEMTYAAGQHAQYNSGVETLLGATPAANDTVHGHVVSGKAIFYGSIVNQTGDPTFVPGVRTREDILIHFAGIDLDENGTTDMLDSNDDGILDQPVVIVSSMYASYFKIVASGEFGETLTYEIVSTPTETTLLDGDGLLRVAAAGDVKNTGGEILIKASNGTSSTILTIPVLFK